MVLGQIVFEYILYIGLLILLGLSTAKKYRTYLLVVADELPIVSLEELGEYPMRLHLAEVELSEGSLDSNDGVSEIQEVASADLCPILPLSP